MTRLRSSGAPARRGRRCPVVGCFDPPREGHLMCRHHWLALPAALRREVDDSWREYSAAIKADPEAALAMHPRYRLAAEAAVQFHNGGES